MFDYPLRAEVKRIETLIPKVDGPVKKVCRVTFRREIDVDIARALGGQFAVEALGQLHSRGITQIVFPIEAITVRATVKGAEDKVLVIDVVSGLKAVAKAKKTEEDKEAEPPMVELKFQFDYSREAWVFFGDNDSVQVEVTLSRKQLSLALDGKAAAPAATKPNGKKGRRKGGATKSSHGDDRAEAAGEIIDPQNAATPEEAEEIRAQRMREQQQEHAAVWADSDGASVQ